jgi:autotransporter translocation and assembly factor TamB
VDGAGRIEVVGRAEPQFKLADGVRLISEGDHSWASRVNLALSVAVDSLSLRAIAALHRDLGTLTGWSTLRATVSGTPADPNLRLAGRGVALAFRGVGLEAVSFEGAYEHRRLTISNMEMQQGKAVSFLKGYIPVDLSFYAPKRGVPEDPLELSLRMTDADFGVAALFVQEIASSSGKLTVVADVSGTAGRPRVSGTLRLTDGVIRFSGRDEILEDVALDATISEQRITAARITAREGKKGTLKGSGWWHWVRGTPLGEYELQFHAQDFTATDRESYLLRFTGDFTIKNGKAPDGQLLPQITGTAFVSRGELTWTQEPAGLQAPEPLGFLYEVRLEVPRNLWFRNLDTEVELGGTLVVKNEGKGDNILGDLDVLHGRYYVCYAKFQMQSGTISFHSLDKIDPDVTIDAQSTVPSPVQTNSTQVDFIKMALTGHSSQLKIAPYDDPGTNPSMLWKALCIGQMSSVGLEEVGSAASNPTTPAADMTLPIRDYLFRNVERLLGDVGIIDTIDLKSGQVTTRSAVGGAPAIGAVGVGKYVTPTLYLRYSRDFSGTAERSISAEYRVTRHLLLKGEQVQRPTQKTPEAYNLDLKIRLEY